MVLFSSAFPSRLTAETFRSQLWVSLEPGKSFLLAQWCHRCVVKHIYITQRRGEATTKSWTSIPMLLQAPRPVSLARFKFHWLGSTSAGVDQHMGGQWCSGREAFWSVVEGGGTRTVGSGDGAKTRHLCWIQAMFPEHTTAVLSMLIDKRRQWIFSVIFWGHLGTNALLIFIVFWIVMSYDIGVFLQL